MTEQKQDILRGLDRIMAKLSAATTHVERAQAIAARPTTGPRDQYVRDEIARASAHSKQGAKQ